MIGTPIPTTPLRMAWTPSRLALALEYAWDVGVTERVIDVGDEDGTIIVSREDEDLRGRRGRVGGIDGHVGNVDASWVEACEQFLAEGSCKRDICLCVAVRCFAIGR